MDMKRLNNILGENCTIEMIKELTTKKHFLEKHISELVERIMYEIGKHDEE